MPRRRKSSLKFRQRLATELGVPLSLVNDPRGLPSPGIRALLETAARLDANGKSIDAAAETLGINEETLKRHRRRYRPFYDARLKSFAFRSKPKWGPVKAKRRKPPSVPTEETTAILQAAAKLMAAGYSLPGAAQTLEIREDTLQRQRSLYSGVFDEAYARALAEQRDGAEIVINKPTPHNKQKLPRSKARKKIVSACSLLATGASDSEVAKALGVQPGQISYWRTKYPELWEREYGRAMQAAVMVVRRQAGTDAVLKDPEGYIRQALLCEKWTNHNNQDLFPKPDQTTLSEFYRTYYEPVRLADASPNTRKSYEITLRSWVLFTGEPPLAEITVSTLAHFRDCLKKVRGQLPGTTAANNTVRRHLTHLSAILNKAGPAGPRNRDAAGLIDVVPWVKPPREEVFPPEPATAEQLGAVYRAAEGMSIPRVPGVSPADWWRALLVTAASTGLRKGALLKLEFAFLDVNRQRLNVPPRLSKTGRGQRIPLQAITLDHLLRIQGPRDLIFPWPHGDSHFHRLLHALQDLAGIPRSEHFGLQNIRQALATWLWEIAPQAAQLGMGHTTPRTTRNHYVMGDGILARALEALPLAETFQDGAECS